MLVVAFLSLCSRQVLFAQQQSTGCYAAVTADFAERDKLPESGIAPSRWIKMKDWGPAAAKYPAVSVPACADSVEWRRRRIIAVAEKYIGLSYRHHHIPAWHTAKIAAGLDCSNFTAWVYNYGLGIKFTSNISEQSDGPLAPGRKLGRDEKLEPGDLLYIMKKDRSRVSHVVIFVDEGHIIDSHAEGVRIREFKGWYKTHFSHARRIVE